MSDRGSFYKIVALFLILVVMLPVIFACDDDADAGIRGEGLGRAG